MKASICLYSTLCVYGCLYVNCTALYRCHCQVKTPAIFIYYACRCVCVCIYMWAWRASSFPAATTTAYTNWAVALSLYYVPLRNIAFILHCRLPAAPHSPKFDYDRASKALHSTRLHCVHRRSQHFILLLFDCVGKLQHQKYASRKQRLHWYCRHSSSSSSCCSSSAACLLAITMPIQSNCLRCLLPAACCLLLPPTERRYVMLFCSPLPLFDCIVLLRYFVCVFCCVFFL